MLRLADQLLLNGIQHHTTDPHAKELHVTRALLSDLRQHQPVILVDDIWQLGVDHGLRVNGNMIPPFPICFLEANSPTDPNVSQIGWYVLSTRADDECRAQVPGSEWRVVISLIYRSKGESVCCFPDYVASCYLDKDGTLLAKGIHCPESPDDVMLYAVPLFTFGLMNCKNVRLKEAPEAAQTRKWHRRTKTPEIRFRTITIDATTKTEYASESHHGNGSKVALHRCRRHTRTYKQDGRGMFGRGIYGTFTIEAHTRGSLECGQVISTYDVKAPNHNEPKDAA